MTARVAKQYIDGLRDDRRVRVDGVDVTDVTQYPPFQGAIRTVGDVYDLQHAHADICLTVNDDGEKVGITHVAPKSVADLQQRHAAIELIARRTLGFLGRSPDYLNVTLTSFATDAQLRWSELGNPQGARRLMDFQSYVALNDLCMTHALVHPTVDKSQDEMTAKGGVLPVRKIGETAEGIVVRGARALATLAPFSDEILVYAARPLAASSSACALAFSIPAATPGLTMLCRDNFSTHSHRTPEAAKFDHPLSHQFDEQDAMLIFDDVVIPHERVFIDGHMAIYNSMQSPSWAANAMQQTSVRAMVKLQFAYELAVSMADILNDVSPGTASMLGELWSYFELTRDAIEAAESGATEWGNGVWMCDDRPFRALRPILPTWFPRVGEIIRLIGSHNLLTTPTWADFHDPSLTNAIDTYYVGAGTHGALDRARVFRAAWDFVGSTLGARGELYERFYLASAPRTFQMAHINAQRISDPSKLLINEFLFPNGRETTLDRETP
jgi:4-hydroxyphenylacetate 3-monooxygenase